MSRVSTSIFAIYISILLYTTIPYIQRLNVEAGKGAQALFWNHLAIFVIFFLISFFVLGRHISSFAGHSKLVISFISLVALILVVLYRVVPIAPVYKLPAILAPYFATDLAFTIWLLAPLAILFF